MALTAAERQREKVYRHRHRPVRHTAIDRIRWHLNAPFFRFLRYLLVTSVVVAVLCAAWFSIAVPALYGTERDNLDQARVEFSREADATYDRLIDLRKSGVYVEDERRRLHDLMTDVLEAQTRDDIERATDAVRTIGEGL